MQFVLYCLFKVQVIPWVVSDSSYIDDPTVRLDPKRTVGSTCAFECARVAFASTIFPLCAGLRWSFARNDHRTRAVLDYERPLRQCGFCWNRHRQAQVSHW